MARGSVTLEREAGLRDILRCHTQDLSLSLTDCSDFPSEVTRYPGEGIVLFQQSWE